MFLPLLHIIMFSETIIGRTDKAARKISMEVGGNLY